MGADCLLLERICFMNVLRYVKLEDEKGLQGK